jgi:hypothetical protein
MVDSVVAGTFFVDLSSPAKLMEMSPPILSLVQGIRTLPAKFLLNSFLSKLAPHKNYITDLFSSFNSATESVMLTNGGDYFS